MVDYLTQEMINWKELSQQQVLLVPFGMGAYVHFAKNQGDFRGSKNIIFLEIICIKRGGDLLKKWYFWSHLNLQVAPRKLFDKKINTISI